MKTKQHVSSFFFHVIVEIALMKGWDFELTQTPEEYLEACSDSTKEMVLYKLKNSNATLTVHNAIELINGTISDESLEFFNSLYKMILESTPEVLYDPHYVVFVSMHSGSSDYFTVSMLQDVIKISPFSSEE
ncbi:hypothetical protein [Proteus phage 2]|nr:hypothetical protein [Proteus phage 1]QNN97887.1 hypothetical protein [Proteus phage 2]QOC54995.1 hypothetical protein [Proteus phage M4H10_20]